MVPYPYNQSHFNHVHDSNAACQYIGIVKNMFLPATTAKSRYFAKHHGKSLVTSKLRVWTCDAHTKNTITAQGTKLLYFTWAWVMPDFTCLPIFFQFTLLLGRWRGNHQVESWLSSPDHNFCTQHSFVPIFTQEIQTFNILTMVDILILPTKLRSLLCLSQRTRVKEISCCALIVEPTIFPQSFHFHTMVDWLDNYPQYLSRQGLIA